MKSFFERNTWCGHLTGILLLVVMVIAGVIVKEGGTAKTSGAQNLEATFHALLTIESLRQNEIHDHWLLPTVTLGRESDAFVPWGATVPTQSGDYIYTSFTPPGFLLPYMVFEVFDLKATVKNLARFNMAVGALVTLALYLFISQLILNTGTSVYAAVLAGLGGVSVAVFSREALLSTGIIYWPHAVYQLLLVCSLWLLFNILKFGFYHRTGALSAKTLPLFLFLGAWTEWTGYVFNTGLVFILWFHTGKREFRKLALRIIAITVAAGIFTLVHYGVVLGLPETIGAFNDRFFARSAQNGSIVDLIDGYILSYGVFLIIAIVVAVRRFIVSRGFVGHDQAMVSMVLLASSVPLIENVIMLQHATQFSFDRLKFIIPSAVLIALALIDRSFRFRAMVISATVFACIHGVKSYQDDMARYSYWAQHDQENVALIDHLREEVDFNCATFSSNIGVRGYANLLIGRSIYEYKTPEQAVALNRERGGCASVFLEGQWILPDLQRYDEAIVNWPDGRKFSLTAEAVK